MIAESRCEIAAHHGTLDELRANRNSCLTPVEPGVACDPFTHKA